MSELVDVLAVMSRIEDKVSCSDFWDVSITDLLNARAEVADLIEAGSAYAEIVASSDNWTGDEQRYFAQMAGAELDSSRWTVIQMAQSRLERALARVRGAA